MPRIYKIHPAIGIARVGMSDDGYFLAPESLGGKPSELTSTGQDAPFRGYKDGARLVRRQAARFRIYEYERDASGKETLLREITSSDAAITWNVELASRKAAGVQMLANGSDADGKGIVVPGAGFRNNPPPGYTRADLAAVVKLQAKGIAFTPPARPMGQVVGNPTYIGEARTDAAGRLVVLGGHGVSRSWLTPAPQLGDFLNNPGWYDDIADGPVDAKVTLNGSGVELDAVGAWVVTAPPDFAPDVTAISTLYDVALQAFAGEDQATVSYPMDIEPIFKRAASYAWVNEAGGGVWWPAMEAFLAEPEKLVDNSAAGKPHREEVHDTLISGQDALFDYVMTKRQRNLLKRWADGQFIPGVDPARPALDQGQLLDQAALTRAVGGGFFPGIEAGLLLRTPSIYAGLCRLTRGNFTDFGNVTAKLGAGSLTERMACPWQADFVQCLGAWWPAQRPDFSLFTEAGAEVKRDWDRGVRVGSSGNHASRKGMVDHFAQLGVIEAIEVGGKMVMAEKGRDPGLASS